MSEVLLKLLLVKGYDQSKEELDPVEGVDQVKEEIDPVVKDEVDKVKDEIYPNNKSNNNNLFYIGQKFHTISEFDEAKAKYEELHFCELWKQGVRTLASAQKRVPKRAANADLNLQYYSHGCQFEIYIVLSHNGKAFEVVKVADAHNHSLSEQLYRHSVRLKANSKLIQHKIQISTGLPVTLKDIANLKAKAKVETNSNDLDVVVDYLKGTNGAVVEVAIDEDALLRTNFWILDCQFMCLW
ncbi:Hypothetical predicted protein [Paramuricea clavata]|uniref:Uncharacterized protein n=1 Tax=Paramuricea clavata TaxID=317549 RepID=A0A6S7FQM1_PARCT|nr:Hypothetical predicted protein [Paramuricea clavata]